MKILYAALVGLALAVRDPREDGKVVALVRDLTQLYYVTCTTILFKDGVANERVFWIGRFMMTSHGFQGSVSVQSIGGYLKAFRGRHGRLMECARLFYLVLADDADVREDVVRSVRVSDTIWLVYLNQSVAIPEFFEEINAAYNMDMLVAQPITNGNIKISEVYRVRMDRPIRVRDYAVWSESEGLTSTVVVASYRRRQNLEGIDLKVVLKHSPPNHVVGPCKKRNGICLNGVLGEIWRNMERRLNFTSSYTVANESGILIPNRGWSGVIGMMTREGMDVGLGEVTMSPERCSAIHCLRPIISTRNQLYFKKTRLRLQWDAVLKPFHSDTWVAIMIWFASCSTCLNVCFRISKSYTTERGQANFNFNFFNSLSTVYSALCQQGSYHTPESFSCRIIFFMSYIVAAILFTVYSASLTSFLSLRQPFRPFENLEQLLRDGTHTLQPVRNSAAYVSFANATDAFTKEVYRKLIEIIPTYALPGDKLEALDRVCRDKKVVYVGTEFETKTAVGKINRQGECEIISLEKPLNLVYITIVVSKSSHFKDLFNFHLDALNYNGIMNRFLKRAWAKVESVKEEGFSGVELAQVFQMYVMLVLGICLSCGLFLLEKLVHGAVRRREGKKRD